MRIEDWMEIGRHRTIAEPLDPPPGEVLDLGAGKNPVAGAIPLDKERGWDADRDWQRLPADEDSVGLIWMNGFIDYVLDPVEVLADCAEVLVDGGLVNIVVPHAMAELGSSDIHKKTHWTEESFKHLLTNEWYEPEGGDLPFRVHTQFILGVVWRNLSLFTQLVRLDRD